MWHITYTEPRSNTGMGSLLASWDRVLDYMLTLDIVDMQYVPMDSLPVFTPAVAAACIGESASL